MEPGQFCISWFSWVPRVSWVSRSQSDSLLKDRQDGAKAISLDLIYLASGTQENKETKMSTQSGNPPSPLTGTAGGSKSQALLVLWLSLRWVL